MKKIFFIGFFIFFIFIPSSFGENFTKIRETKPVFKTPESVLYNKTKQVIYVANINGKPTDRDGNGFISKLNIQGDLIELKFIEGLNAPKGMAVFKNYLYVADISHLIKIDLNKKKVIKKYNLNGKFLNDVDVDENGNVYVSDTAQNKIFKIEKDKEFVLIEDSRLKRPNGVKIFNNNLYIGSSQTGTIFLYELFKQKLKKFDEGFESIDGLYISRNLILSSSWGGKLLKKSGDKIVKKKLPHKSADFGIINNQKLLVVPDFNNKLIFYKYD